MEKERHPVKGSPVILGVAISGIVIALLIFVFKISTLVGC